MKTISFDKLLLRTAFCCMATDGNIDRREIAVIESLCKISPYFDKFDFQSELNQLITDINTSGKAFIKNYFDLLSGAQLSEQDELTLIEFTIQTINADEQVEYSEIKFFKNIRHRLKISDEKILGNFPEIEEFLEDDLITGSFLDKITYQYFEATELPQFEAITH